MIHSPTRSASKGPSFALLLPFAWLLATGIATALAHPLGNDSIAQFDVLYVRHDRLELDCLLDIAETPSQYFEKNEIDANKDGQVDLEEQKAWLAAKADEFADGFTARIDDTALRVYLMPDEVDERTGRLISPNKLIVPMLGPLGMTYRMVIRYSADYPNPLDAGEHTLLFENKTMLNYQGLQLILLQPGVLCQIRFTKADAFPAEPILPMPSWVVQRLAEQGLSLDEPDAALLNVAEPTTVGRRRWRLLDRERQYALVERGELLDVYPLPYCEILAPHPPFLSPDNDVFRYEQYDPQELPNVRQATIRFTIFPEKPRQALSIAGMTASAATPPATATAEATSQPVTAESSQLRRYSTTFLDSSFNTLGQTESKLQAEKMIKLLQGRWGFSLFLIVTLTAFAWGAAHAVMPGHAKTVVAAYLISQRGTLWHAIALAVIVTITHTALVVILGVVIYAYQQSNPRLGPMLQLWLGLAAGLMVAGMGVLLAWRAITGRLVGHHHVEPGAEQRSWLRRLFTHSHPHVSLRPHYHDHPHEHEHTHAHGDGHCHHHHDGYMTFKSLLALGIAGGIVPCPTATIILLLGIGADVLAGALYAIVVFSLGLALTLMLIGVAALTSRKYASRLMTDTNHEGELTTTGRRVLLQIVPALSGLAVILLGTAIAVHYASRLYGVQSPPFSWVG